ncbi:hypothetical protein P782_2548 [Enterococcus faecalis FL2]|nr:hypothetical protein P782_2548 [Enterococcus faecalis FL2]
MTAPKPPNAIAEPVKPAINAWLSLVGIPKYHAATAQTTIEKSEAAKATCEAFPFASKLTMLLIVSATWALKKVMTNAPKKFITTAIQIATFGFNTRVETAVAIAFGASVQPLTKITPITKVIVTNNAILTKTPPFFIYLFYHSMF